MVKISFQSRNAAVLRLRDLQQCLNQMNHEEQQWVALPVPSTVHTPSGREKAYIAIGYSNPSPGEHQNYLCYLFPALPHTGVKRGSMLTFLHPQIAVPLSRGMYLEEGKLRFDGVKDWDHFWVPLKERLLELGVPGESLGPLA